MQKLEEILHAEDSARYRLADAREQAQQIAREATAEAELIREESKREAAAEAALARELIVSEAGAKAESIRADAEQQLRSMLQAAEARTTRATEAVARELTR